MQYSVLSRLPHHCPSLKDITQSFNVILFLDFNWEQRQLSTRLRSFLLSYDGSQVLTNLRMLMVTVILNFKQNLERTQDSFWSFLEIRTIYILFCMPSFSTCTYHHQLRLTTPPHLACTQTATASQPRYHYQHDGQELQVQGRAIRQRMPKRHCRCFLSGR